VLMCGAACCGSGLLSKTPVVWASAIVVVRTAVAPCSCACMTRCHADGRSSSQLHVQGARGTQAVQVVSLRCCSSVLISKTQDLSQVTWWSCRSARFCWP
jgi:hypothetical protein